MTSERQSLDQLNEMERELPGLMDEAVALFVADAPVQMGQIETAYQARDAATLRPIAHFLRSGAFALGLRWLGEHATRVERLEVWDYGTPDSNALVAELHSELDRVVVALQERQAGK